MFNTVRSIRMTPLRVVLLLILGLGCAYWAVQWRAEYVRSLRAPRIDNGDADVCALSPSGRYLFVDAQNSRYSVYDTQTHERIVTIYDFYPEGFWTQDDVYVLRYTSGSRYALIDPHSRAVRATPSLTADEQAFVSNAVPAPMIRAPAQLTAWLAPNGRYIMTQHGITDAAGTLINPVIDSKFLNACLDGWRPDSTGFYYISRQSDFSFFSWAGDTGPVRLLLVAPRE